ncbi:probable L-gulonolactone oxidase 6 [Neltuma alba]|uniref:probable L-gulonolactone oxidase 6 n=1 Tax=Neltuma alba TaxID=207710 RepID=UPI0010A47082|nr:probable L-gulonolactone oxidase 6 [Prosopis alba]XP_028782992.1 probable L-gulonolactone oxidase 6 [Prosopis alba]
MKILKSTLIIFLIVFVNGVLSSPPDDPVQCTSGNKDCTVTNSYGVFPDRSTCRASQVMYPTTEQELTSMVASASKSNTKVKAATRYSHSIPKLACPGGQDGIIISTNKLNRVVKVDAESRRMTVESGVLLREVISEAAKNGLTLPYTPYWWGITMGGLLATGAHGSSLWKKGSAIHEYVVSMRIVTPAAAEEGYAKVRSLTESDEELDAAKVSLGVLGVVSQVTLQLEPMFKRALTYVEKDDSDLAEELVNFGKEHEFGDVGWFPSQKKALYRVDDRVSNKHSGNGLYDFIPFRPTLTATLAATRGTEELQEKTRDANGKCIGAKLVTGTLKTAAYGLTNNGIFFTGYPVVGPNNRMQSSGTCLDSLEDGKITICPWDSRLGLQFFHQTAFTISLSNIPGFIKDVQKLVELEPQALCGLELNNGILMRYVKASSAYLGKTEDAVDFDITYFRSKDPLSPRLFEDIYEEIEQMGLFKYGGLPHWGKNRNLAFIEVIKKYPNAQKFLSVKNKYDPQGIFSSEWTDQVLGLKESVTTLKDGCALEGLCICSEDRHCAPSKKYYCRPGKVYKEARVCAFDNEANLKDEL